MPIATAGLTGFLPRLGDFAPLTQALAEGKSPLALSGLAAVHRAYVAAGLRQATGRPLVLVCPDDGEARRMAGDLAALTGGEVPLLPARDFLFHPGAASRQWEHQRLEILARLTRGDCPVLVATVEGLLQRTLPPDVFAGHCRQLSVGQVCQLEEVADFLVQAGYTRCDQVEGTGQFALRGGILDVFSPGLDLPVRMEFWGDEIESIDEIDQVTGEVLNSYEALPIWPASHYVTARPKMDKALGTIQDELRERLMQFKEEGKLLEAQRLEMRVNYDLEMLETVFSEQNRGEEYDREKRWLYFLG